jgi:hypothetical protein
VGDALAVALKTKAGDEALYVSVDTAGTRASKQKPSYPWHADVRGLDGRAVQIFSASGKGSALVRFSKAPLSSKKGAAEAGSPLEHADWQQLTIAEGADDLETSLGVVRSAKRAGPSAGASSVRLTGIDAFPNGLDIVISENGGVFVPRPRKTSEWGSWLALDTSAALTPRDLSLLRQAARRGDPKIARSALSHPQAELAARGLAGGDKAQFTRQLKALSRELGPEQSRQEVLHHLEDAAELQLRRGDPVEATRLYDIARDHFGEGSPDAQVKQTLAGMASGKSGPETLNEVLLRHQKKLSLNEREQVLKVAQGLSDMPDVADVLQARLGLEGPIPMDVEPRIQLESDGPDVVSTHRPEKPLRVSPIAPFEFKQGVPEGATFYVEDGHSFNKNDFQANPSANVAELGNNPEVEFVRVQEMETGTYRPGKIYEKAAQGADSERTYHRVAGPREGDASQAPSYLIRHIHVPPHRALPCDLNGDGVETVSERELCKAA